jgi:hypothetical protein
MATLRLEIVPRSGEMTHDGVQRLKNGLCHISIDAGFCLKKKVVDFYLLNTNSPRDSSAFLLYESDPVTGKANSAFCKYQTVTVLEKVHRDHIEIISMVGDGFKL